MLEFIPKWETYFDNAVGSAFADGKIGRVAVFKMIADVIEKFSVGYKSVSKWHALSLCIDWLCGNFNISVVAEFLYDYNWPQNWTFKPEFKCLITILLVYV